MRPGPAAWRPAPCSFRWQAARAPHGAMRPLHAAMWPALDATCRGAASAAPCVLAPAPLAASPAPGSPPTSMASRASHARAALEQDAATARVLVLVPGALLTRATVSRAARVWRARAVADQLTTAGTSLSALQQRPVPPRRATRRQLGCGSLSRRGPSARVASLRLQAHLCIRNVAAANVTVACGVTRCGPGDSPERQLVRLYRSAPLCRSWS